MNDKSITDLNAMSFGHQQSMTANTVRQANADMDIQQLATEHTGNGTRWHSTSTGAVLADCQGRIIGSVKRLNADGHFMTNTGYSYVDVDSAKRAVEANQGQQGPAHITLAHHRV
jgi:hypothetical protein